MNGEGWLRAARRSRRRTPRAVLIFCHCRLRCCPVPRASLRYVLVDQLNYFGDSVTHALQIFSQNEAARKVWWGTLSSTPSRRERIGAASVGPSAPENATGQRTSPQELGFYALSFFYGETY